VAAVTACRRPVRVGGPDRVRHPGVCRAERMTTPKGEGTMATDYDQPRKTDDDLSEDSIEELKARTRSDKSSGVVDTDESELAESFELPGADLSNEELSVRVLPRQADE